MEQLQCRLYVFRELLCWQNFGTDDCCCITINVLLSDLWCLWDDNRICGRMDLPGPSVFNMLKFPFKTHSVWIYFQSPWESIWFYLQVHADVPYLKKLVMNPLHLWLKHLNVSILMQVQGYDFKSYSWLSRQKKVVRDFTHFMWRIPWAKQLEFLCPGHPLHFFQKEHGKVKQTPVWYELSGKIMVFSLFSERMCGSLEHQIPLVCWQRFIASFNWSGTCSIARGQIPYRRDWKMWPPRCLWPVICPIDNNCMMTSAFSRPYNVEMLSQSVDKEHGAAYVSQP